MGSGQPPPEKVDATRTRSWIIYSFWAVILFLGAPMWWRTTLISRAALPLQEMLTWADAAERQPHYFVPIRVSAPDLACEDAQRLLSATQTILNERTSSWGFSAVLEPVRFVTTSKESMSGRGSNCNIQEVLPNDRAVSLDVELRAAATVGFDLLSGSTPILATYVAAETMSLATTLAQNLQQALVDEQVAVSWQYYTQGRSEPGMLDYINSLPTELRKNAESSAARAFKPSTAYHLTFSLFTPGGLPTQWDIEDALNQYINPVLHALSASANFSVATQIQLYSAYSPSIQPYQEEGQSGWFLHQNDLTAFVNTAEWPLAPSIGLGPTINFVLFVPAKQQTPLRVQGTYSVGSLGGSWIVPQWGGLTILNAPIVQNDPQIHKEDVVAHLTIDLLKPAFEVFQGQLLALLGVPASSTISLPLRLKAFQRLSALSLHLKTGSNLGALARLAQHLNNIPIPRHVSDLVDSAMENLRKYQVRSASDNLVKAANQGYTASEKAFFDKSMVGQVYFPDEHKVAVYLPLLGPIGVPLLVGLIREIKALAARIKA